MVKTIFYTLASLVRRILLSLLENKTNIFAPPCNSLYIMLWQLLFFFTQNEKLAKKVPQQAEHDVPLPPPPDYERKASPPPPSSPGTFSRLFSLHMRSGSQLNGRRRYLLFGLCICSGSLSQLSSSLICCTILIFFFSIYTNIQPLWHDISNIGPIVISGGFLFAMHQHTTRILIPRFI